MSASTKLFWGAVYLALFVILAVHVTRNIRVMVLISAPAFDAVPPSMIERPAFKRMSLRRSSLIIFHSRQSRATCGPVPFVVGASSTTMVRESNTAEVTAAHAAGPQQFSAFIPRLR